MQASPYTYPALLALGLALVACERGASDQQTAPAESQSVTLSAGDPAPNVTLHLQNGKDVKLASLKGQHVIVYFYPKDDTPGCTIEAQGMRDAHERFQKASARVFGVSTQDAESHTQFIEKYGLPFDLVVDSEGDVARAFKVPVRLGVAARQTFLIGPDGKIARVWDSVSPDGHAEEILAALAK